MKKRLSPEGLVYINVPNISSVQWMVGLRKVPNIYSFPMHLQYFTPKSMASYLREAGLEPLFVATRWMAEHVSDDLVFKVFLGHGLEDIVSADAWKAAICENLLGGELFMLAGHPTNTKFSRMSDLNQRIEEAFQFQQCPGIPKADEKDAEIARLRKEIAELRESSNRPKNWWPFSRGR